MISTRRASTHHRLALGIVAALTVAGCATAGPGIKKTELKSAERWLEAKAVRFRHEQLLRVNRVGYQIVSKLPAASHVQDEDGKPPKEYPYVGWLLAHVDKRVAAAYGLKETKGVAIIGVIPNSPAEHAGLKAGDVLTTLNDQEVPFQHKVAAVMEQLHPDQSLEVRFLRRGEEQSAAVLLRAVPKNIVFRMTADEDINAYAAPGGVVTVTYGMMRFAHSDDELAVVLGHELAHITEHHIMKNLGTGLVAGVVGGTLQIVIDVFAPGLGGPVGQGAAQAIQSQFSKDFEREADFKGLQYAYAAGFDPQAGQRVWERFAVEIPRSMASFFLSSHPPSPERMIRLQKTAYALTHHIPLDQIERADIPLQLDPALEAELAEHPPTEGSSPAASPTPAATTPPSHSE